MGKTKHYIHPSFVQAKKMFFAVLWWYTFLTFFCSCYPAQSQFVVFVRSSGVVSLQNVNDPSVFIDITDDELVAVSLCAAASSLYGCLLLLRLPQQGNGNVNSQFIVNEVGKSLGWAWANLTLTHCSSHMCLWRHTA